MAEHPHVALVRRGYEALARGDMDAMSEIASNEVEFHIPGDHPLAGDYKGSDAYRRYYRRLMEATSGGYRVELEHVFMDGRGHVIAVHRGTAERDGRMRHQLLAVLYTITNDKVTAINVFDEDIDASNQFWS
jgi:uncharacterized protein